MSALLVEYLKLILVFLLLATIMGLSHFGKRAL